MEEWCEDTKSKCSWQNVPFQTARDVDLSLNLSNEKHPVELILFEGRGPVPTHPVWSLNSVGLIVWLVKKGQSGPVIGK